MPPLTAVCASSLKTSKHREKRSTLANRGSMRAWKEERGGGMEGKIEDTGHECAVTVENGVKAVQLAAAPLHTTTIKWRIVTTDNAS